MQIIVTQPRKIAAQELAGRVAFEYAAGNQHHAKQAGVLGSMLGAIEPSMSKPVGSSI